MSNELIGFIDPNNGYAVGEGIILKTSDGGKNWITLLNGGVHLFSVYFTQYNKAFVAGNDGTIVKIEN